MTTRMKEAGTPAPERGFARRSPEPARRRAPEDAEPAPPARRFVRGFAAGAERESIQATPHGGMATARTPAEIHRAAQRGVSGASGPLPHLDAIQESFGRHDVTKIAARVGGDAAAAAEAMGASAFAMGERLAFAGTPSLRIAAHEAAHVVQQRAGVELAGGVGQAGDRYERHADAVADRVVQGLSSEALLDTGASRASRGAARGPAGAVTQRAPAVQRVLTAEGRLPEAEKPDVLHFLEANTFERNHFSEPEIDVLRAKYNTIRDYDAILSRDSKSLNSKERRKLEERQRGPRDQIQPKYQEMLDYAADKARRKGSAGWDVAVGRGKDEAWGGDEKGVDDGIGRAWRDWSQLETNPPSDFKAAVEEMLKSLEKTIADTYQTYQEEKPGSNQEAKLNAGTMHALQRVLAREHGGRATPAQIVAKLEGVYQRQRKVSQANWLKHLDVETRLMVVGSDAAHYTIFANAIGDTGARPVNGESKMNDLREALFGTKAVTERIHATVVSGGLTYHEYWGKEYRPARPPDARRPVRADGEGDDGEGGRRAVQARPHRLQRAGTADHRGNRRVKLAFTPDDGHPHLMAPPRRICGGGTRRRPSCV
jgi:hypothetical protein